MTAKKPAKKKKEKGSDNIRKTKNRIPAIREEKEEEPSLVYARVFETYALWKNLPPMLKGVTPKDLEDKYFIDDEDLITLLQIRTQRAFADHFKVNERTLWEWNGKLRSGDRDQFADIRNWTKQLMKNVMMSTYRAAMLKDPKANSDRKLFLQFNGWGEEINVNNKGETLTELFKRGLGIE